MTALVDIVGCTAGKKIEFQSVPCQITIGEQNGLSHVVFTNNAGAPHSVSADFTLSGLAYELHGLSCGHPTTLITEDGSLSAKVKLQAYKDLGSHLATEHGHQFLKNTHDNIAVGLLST